MAGRFSVEAVFKAVDRVTAPVSRMQKRIGKMTRAADRGFRKATRGLNKFVGGMARAAKSVLKFGTGAVLTGVTAVTVALNRTADAADRLAKQSRRLQFPIEELQEWKFVAEQSGVSTELLDKSLGAFTKRLGEARGRMGPLVTGLKKINPQLLRQLQATNDVAQAFEIYVNAMRSAETATEKAALANAAFSRAGLELVNIADNSSDAIRALRLEQRQNGNITKEQAEAAEAYNDALNSLKRSLTGLLQGVLLPMLPTITEMVRTWRDWVIANKDIVRSRIFDFVDTLKRKVMGLVDAVTEFNERYNLADRLGEGLDMMQRFGGWLERNGVSILKVATAVAGLAVVLNTLVGILTLVNLVMAANPITLIVMGVTAAIAAFSALVIWIDDVAAAFDNMNPFIRAILASLELVVRTIQFIKDSFKDGFGGAVTKMVARFGFRGDNESTVEQSGGATGPQIVSPQDRVARSIEEKRTKSTAEVTIKDETGRVELTDGKLGTGLSLQPTGAF